MIQLTLGEMKQLTLGGTKQLTHGKACGKVRACTGSGDPIKEIIHRLLSEMFYHEENFCQDQTADTTSI